MIQVIQRAYILLENIALTPEKIWSIKELARLIDVSPPTCYNIVDTLVQLNLIQCLGKRKGYCAGSLQIHQNFSMDLRKINRINELFRRFEQEYHYLLEQSLYNHGYRLITAQISPQNPLFVHYNSLISDDILLTLSGKMLLAHQEKKEQILFFQKKKQGDHLVINTWVQDLWPHEPTLEDFLAELEDTRKKYFLERSIRGSFQLIFPVYNDQNQLSCVLGTVGPAYSYTPERKEKLLQTFYDLSVALKA